MKTIRFIILLFILGFFALNLSGCSGSSGSGNIPDFSLSWAIGSGDVNNDGLYDLVIGHTGMGKIPATISIWLQDPVKPGQFTKNVRTVTYSPYGIKLADLNADGRLDIIILSGTAVSVYLQDPVLNGTFPTEVTYFRPSGTSRAIVEVGDINGDGKIDIATVNGNGVSIFFQDIANPGSFFPNVTILENIGVTSLAIEDLNGDGLDDIAVGRYSQNKISVYTQDPLSLGTFILVGDYTMAYAPDYLSVADLNDDNEPDIAASNANFVSLFVQDINQPGTFLPASNLSVNANLDKIATADLNKDGLNDIAAISYSSNALVIFIQDPLSPGTFLLANTYGSKTPFDFTIVDFNDDNNLDIAAACSNIDYIYFQDPINLGIYLLPAYGIE